MFLDSKILPDQKILAIAFSDAFYLGVLSSRIHVVWALAAGGRLGVGNDPVYNQTRCFDPFPFPDATEAQKDAIRRLAEELDAHRPPRRPPDADDDGPLQHPRHAPRRAAAHR